MILSINKVTSSTLTLPLELSEVTSSTLTLPLELSEVLEGCPEVRFQILAQFKSINIVAEYRLCLLRYPPFLR